MKQNFKHYNYSAHAHSKKVDGRFESSFDRSSESTEIIAANHRQLRREWLSHESEALTKTRRTRVISSVLQFKLLNLNCHHDSDTGRGIQKGTS